MVPLQRQKTYTRVHSVIYLKKATIITLNDWQKRVLGRNLTTGKFKTSAAQCNSHVEITYKLCNYCFLHLSLFTVCYLQLCCGKYQELCNYRRRSRIVQRLPEALPELSRSTMQTLLPDSLINFQYSSDYSGEVKYNSSTFRT